MRILLPSKNSYIGPDDEFAYILESKLKFSIRLRPYLKYWRRVEKALIITLIVAGLIYIYHNINPY